MQCKEQGSALNLKHKKYKLLGFAFGPVFPTVLNWKLLFTSKVLNKVLSQKLKKNSKYSKTFEPEAEPDLEC